MNRIYTASTSTEIWHDLVEEAEQETHQVLEQEVEGYLVMTLIRYQKYAELNSHILAMDYLRAHGSGGEVRRQRLQQLGDISLLFSGLYPEQADRRMVRSDYFIQMGKGAYRAAAEGARSAAADMFCKLSRRFVPLSKVLRAIHDQTSEARPHLLEAWEQWSGLGDQQAWQTLSRNGAIPVNMVGRA